MQVPKNFVDMTVLVPKNGTLGEDSLNTISSLIPNLFWLTEKF